MKKQQTNQLDKSMKAVTDLPGPTMRVDTEEACKALLHKKLRGDEFEVLEGLREWDVLVWEVSDYVSLCDLNHAHVWDVLWEEVEKVEGVDIPDLALRLSMTTRALSEQLISRRDMTFEQSVREIFRTLSSDAVQRMFEPMP